MAATPERIHPPDAIVTLGLQLQDNGKPEPELLERVEASVDLCKYWSETSPVADILLVMSGCRSGSAVWVPPRTESEVMKEHGVKLGVSVDRILEEDDSLCTWGNALYTKAITERLGLRRLVVVSTSYHLLIGEMAFKHSMGPEYEIIAIPSADPPLTPAQIRYQEAAKLTAKEIIESTDPGDDAAIKAKLVQLQPVYKPLFGVVELVQRPEFVYQETDQQNLLRAA
jgi:uncharacterized SAM-binding protein YcdF (DUF218 family)